MAIAFHVLTIKPKTIKQRPKKTNDGYSDEKKFFFFKNCFQFLGAKAPLGVAHGRKKKGRNEKVSE